MSGVTLRPAGDAAWFIELENRLDEAVNERAIAIGRAIDAARLPGVRDVVTGYRSIAVHVDPLRADAAAMEEALLRLASEATVGAAEAAGIVQVPVCYGGEFGPDLAEVAAFARMPGGDGRRAARGPHVSRLHGRIRAGVPVYGHGGPADCDAAAREPALKRARALGRHCGARRPASTRRRARAAGG